MKFLISQQTEAERVMNNLVIIMSGFIERSGFVVVPELNESINTNTQVILPRIDYESIPGLWERLKLANSDIPTNVEQEWIDKLAIKIKNYDPVCEERCLELQNQWEGIEEEFFIELERDFPNIRARIGEIEVRLSEYGTISSGTWKTDEASRPMNFYLRSDRGLGDLASMLVNLVLMEKKDELGITWSKREALMDYVMSRPAMKKLFPDFRPVMNELGRVPAQIRQQSAHYLSSLKIPRNTRDLELAKGKLLVRGKVVTRELGEKEVELVKALLKKEGEVVTYDAIADVLWGEGEFKSYSAINKLVERVRKKLIELGVDILPLRPVRGQGYMWEG